MARTFKSKIGLELVVPLTLVLGTALILSLSEEPRWLGPVILLPVILFIAHMFMTTFYVIDGNSLSIRCGFLYNSTIDIGTIKKISETNNPLSSPATSLDRIEIRYGSSSAVIISPKLKKEFIDAILSLYPSVEVKYKK